MKTKKDWENEISKVLGEKVAAAVKQYQEARGLALDELAKLGQQLEDLENRIKTLSSESAGLNLLSNKGLAKRSENDRTLFSLEKHTREIRRQRDEMVQKLTLLPAGITEGPWLNFLLQLKGNGDAKAKKNKDL